MVEESVNYCDSGNPSHKNVYSLVLVNRRAQSKEECLAAVGNIGDKVYKLHQLPDFTLPPHADRYGRVRNRQRPFHGLIRTHRSMWM